jgi:ATP-binding cassette subfamily B protein
VGLWLYSSASTSQLRLLIVLLPMTLFINWRYGLLLIVLCACSPADRVGGQSQRDCRAGRSYYTDGQRTTDTRGNIAWSELRPDRMEVAGMKKMGDDVLGALPVLAGGLATVITRAATTLTMLSIRFSDLLLHARRDHGRRDRDVHELRHAADRKARAGRASPTGW